MNSKAAATLVISAFLVFSAGTGLAQNPAPQSAAPQGAPAQTTAQNAAARAATLSRLTGRFGRTLGLPKDGKDLFIADEDYIRFPLPQGAEAYADVDALKIKAMIGEITAISRKGAPARRALSIAMMPVLPRE